MYVLRNSASFTPKRKRQWVFRCIFHFHIRDGYKHVTLTKRILTYSDIKPATIYA